MCCKFKFGHHGHLKKKLEGSRCHGQILAALGKSRTPKFPLQIFNFRIFDAQPSNFGWLPALEFWS